MANKHTEEIILILFLKNSKSNFYTVFFFLEEF